MSFLIAIDQSTSATKALLIDSDATVIASESLKHKQHYPSAGWVEHDAEEIVSNLTSVLLRMGARHADKMNAVAGVSITNQRESFVVFDRESGAPLCPAIVWQCRRGDDVCKELRAGGAETLVSQKTGLRIDSYFSGPKIAWLMRERPRLAARLRDGSACVSTVDGFLVHRLSGGSVFASDHTNASRTLLYDIDACGWDDELCDVFGVPVRALPEVRESTAVFGHTDLGGLLSRQTPIVGVMGDSQASLFAQRCFDAGEAKATLGTGTSVLVNVGSSRPDPVDGAVTALAWRIDSKPVYALEGIINYSAATLTWLRDQLGLFGDLDEVESLAGAVNDADGVYLVPAFAGLGAPHWRPEARAAIVGMTTRTRREHVVRAALESIGLQVADVLDMLTSKAGPPTRLCVDGGSTTNALLMQMVADLTGCNVEASDETNLSALGAAMAGMVGLGLVPSFEELRELPLAMREFLPTADQAHTETLRTGWNQAVSRVM